MPCRPPTASSSTAAATASSHHHHVVCRHCGRGTEVELPDLERWAETTASDLGYSDVTHTVEIFGVCADCRT